MMAKPFLALLLVVSLFAVVGCGRTEINVNRNASYSELVATYNGEVQSLDNMERKRKEFIAEYAGQAQADALKVLMNSTGSGINPNLPTNPNDLLSQAAAAAETQNKISSELLGQLTSSSTSGDAQSAAIAKMPEEQKQKLADMDGDIAKQKERVERARKARDAAETK